MEELLRVLAKHLQKDGGLDLKECFVDRTFVPTKKAGARRREDQAGQGNQAHGNGRQPWSSYRPSD